MKNIIGIVITLLISLSSTQAHAVDKNMKYFLGKYTITTAPIGSNPSTSILYTAPKSNFNQLISISKTGAMTGLWGRMYTSDELLNNLASDDDSGAGSSETQYDVTLKGKISKIAVSGKNMTATFTFTLSDGAKGTGTIKMFTTGGTRFMPLKRYYTLSGKIRVAGQAGTCSGSK
jgi:hypothetical protein